MQEVGAGLVLLSYPDAGANVTASFDKETDSEVKNKGAAGATAECCGSCLARGWRGAQSQVQENMEQDRTTKRTGQLCHQSLTLRRNPAQD